MTKLGYGLAKLPFDSNGEIDEIKSTEIIKQAFNEGIDIFDTSPFYLNGKSEEIIGKVLSESPIECEISTKISLKNFNTKDEFLDIFNMQLNRLKRDKIDFYLIHGFDKKRLDKFNRLGVWKWLEELKNEEKIKNIGFSFHGEMKLLEEIIDLYHWDVCMIKFSPLDENFETGEAGIKYLNAKKIKVFLIQPYFGGVYVDLINTFERKQQLFYKIWNVYKVDTIFVGTRDKEHLLENINIMKGYYKDKEIKKKLRDFEKFKEEYLNSKVVKCDGCNLCRICKENIAIPYIFAIYNIFKMTNNKKKFIYDYENIIKKHGNYR